MTLLGRFPLWQRPPPFHTPGPSPGCIEWLLVLQTLRTKKMEPTLSVATDVDVNRDDHFNLLIGPEVDPSKIRVAIISPYKLWSTLLYLLLVPVAAKGTAIAIMVTHDRILIAADGAEATIRPGSVYSFGPFCKIRSEGSIFYTAAGYYEVPLMKFNLWTLAANAIRKSKDMIGIYDAIERSVLDRLPPIVKSVRKDDPTNYARWLAGSPIISIAFASFQNGRPRVDTISFHIDRRGTILRPERQTLGGTTAELEDAFLGSNKQIVVATSPRAVFSWGPRFISDPISFIQGLIQLEIDAATREKRNDVGPPIIILSITNSGGHFVPEHKGACQ